MAHCTARLIKCIASRTYYSCNRVSSTASLFGSDRKVSKLSPLLPLARVTIFCFLWLCVLRLPCTHSTFSLLFYCTLLRRHCIFISSCLHRRVVVITTIPNVAHQQKTHNYYRATLVTIQFYHAPSCCSYRNCIVSFCQLFYYSANWYARAYYEN